MINKNTQDRDTIIDDIYNFHESPRRTLRDFTKIAKKKISTKRESVDHITRWATLFLAVFVFFFGIFYIKHGINKPFLRYKNTSGQKLDLLSYTGENLNPILNSQLYGKDSDSDGISDYDEFNIYNTSPYLEDSNSNGKADIEDIKLGNDPNCLLGTECGPLVLNSPYIISPESQPADGASALFGQSSITNPTGLQTDPLLNSLSQDQMNGLLELFNLSAKSDSQTGQNQNTSLDSIKDLPPAELRKILIDQGISEDLINKVSDDELRDLVKDTLKAIDTK